MARMADIPDDYRDLLDAQFATLGTVEPDGTPQLSEIWFLHDNGEIRLSLTPPGARRRTSCSARSAA
jgi:predicted pyridoxine 5'-phosphate oxidase superfamily flavin-nucleotide-binding protein